MDRAFFAGSIGDFLDRSAAALLGQMVQRSGFPVEISQRDAWIFEIELLQRILQRYRGRGSVYFEFAIPRLGKRIDAVLVMGPVVFVLEFKVGEPEFTSHAIDQVFDYALDLKNFHEPSHAAWVAPMLIATRAEQATLAISTTSRDDRLLHPITSTVEMVEDVLEKVLAFADGPPIDVAGWEYGRYCPTPTIIEAASVLYATHSVAEISRSGADEINLTKTAEAVLTVIEQSRIRSHKSICFVTGVPGAGKTLVGLKIASQFLDQQSDLRSVFLSGNGPLVAILREALARDKVRREAEVGKRFKLGQARSEVKAFIQNVHHFRDDCLVDVSHPPIEHVALFDEAQRAWNRDMTERFMRQKKGRPNFDQSEPEFLISCLNRHRDWAVIVCLVGGGQEINTGEAGISEWIASLARTFPDWQLHISSKLTDSEYGAGQTLEQVRSLPHVTFCDELHLGVSMRSFRAENLSLLVKQSLDLQVQQAAQTLKQIDRQYPLVITRDLTRAKRWLREQARGSERYGIVVSSEAQRLKPYAIDVRSPIDPIHWFLDDKEDVRSCYYLEESPPSSTCKGWNWTGPASPGMPTFDTRRKDGNIGHSAAIGGSIFISSIAKLT